MLKYFRPRLQYTAGSSRPCEPCRASGRPARPETAYEHAREIRDPAHTTVTRTSERTLPFPAVTATAGPAGGPASVAHAEAGHERGGVSVAARRARRHHLLDFGEVVGGEVQLGRGAAPRPAARGRRPAARCPRPVRPPRRSPAGRSPVTPTRPIKATAAPSVPPANTQGPQARQTQKALQPPPRQNPRLGRTWRRHAQRLAHPAQGPPLTQPHGRHRPSHPRPLPSGQMKMEWAHWLPQVACRIANRPGVDGRECTDASPPGDRAGQDHRSAGTNCPPESGCPRHHRCRGHLGRSRAFTGRLERSHAPWWAPGRRRG